ncbi:Uncharacterized protein TCM_032217 [Theobroma cacao]|uniref:Uncharacterized protein n=1 Tax=Theobroma cacao TaxID=3641 RepID=A0A061FGL9_THECC|nr:Uncharacterized protein TCM_032217 [Theobroma cacao]
MSMFLEFRSKLLSPMMLFWSHPLCIKFLLQCFRAFSGLLRWFASYSAASPWLVRYEVGFNEKRWWVNEIIFLSKLCSLHWLRALADGILFSD